MQKILSVVLVVLGVLAGCTSAPTSTGVEQETGGTPASSPPDRHSELENCVTAVGADRSQCRAKRRGVESSDARWRLPLNAACAARK